MENRKVRLLTSKKPKINTSGSDLPSMTTAAWNALRRRNNPPFLFNYGDSPHRLEADDAGEKTLILFWTYIVFATKLPGTAVMLSALKSQLKSHWGA